MKRRRFAMALSLVLGGCGMSSSGSGTAKVEASGGDVPEITTIQAMAGGLHVSWRIPANGCDEIHGERKSAAVDYAMVFTTPGDVNNKHDGTTTARTAYTYRLRCKKGATLSGYSSEKSATAE